MSAVPTRGCRAVLVAVGLAGLGGSDSFAQSPPAAPPAAPARIDDALRPVAFIYGNIPVTRQDLGEFLIARGGADKLELVVNKMIIEHECKKRGITVTEKEMEAALVEDLEGLSIKKADFVRAVLPRYGKTLYEWMEDVIRPRLLLSKICQGRVKVDDADLKRQFEREYGEKRQVQIIMWPNGDNLKVIQQEYGKIRESQVEYDRAARAQANPALASSAGHIKPIGRHSYAEDPIVEQIAFQLKPGEVSQILQTKQGYVVMKLHRVIPPDDKVKFEDVKPRLFKQAYDESMTQEIPKCFAELKKAADPRMLFDGPPLWKDDLKPGKSVEDALKGPGTAPPMGNPMEKK
jgi:hypothetical protein